MTDAADGPAPGIGAATEIRNVGGIGKLWTARPNPDQRVPLNKRKGADVEGRSPRALTVRIVDAAAVAIKFQAVIRALDVTVFQYAIAQRCEAMRADVEHCRCATIGLAVHDDGDCNAPSAKTPRTEAPRVGKEGVRTVRTR